MLVVHMFCGFSYLNTHKTLAHTPLFNPLHIKSTPKGSTHPHPHTLSQELGNLVLGEILSGNPTEDVVAAVHQHLRDVAEKLAANAVPLSKFIITKQLTKRIEDYPDAKNQPHVQVAMRRRAAGMHTGTMPVGEGVWV